MPLVEEWGPDLVVHPITELAAAVAAERCGARHAVHGLGPLPREAWDWFGARFRDLCTSWDVPDLGTAILERPYVDDCPPSLQRDAVAAFGNRRRVRATPGEAAPGEHLPWSDDDLAGLPFEQTVHLTLGTMFHGATEVFQTALEGLTRLEVNVLVTVGPDTDPARLGPEPAQVLVADFVAHELLLPHCDALVTQGGAGTIVAALCAGLPHLILPQGADQFVNGATAEAAGVALTIPPAELTADGVADAVGGCWRTRRLVPQRDGLKTRSTASRRPTTCSPRCSPTPWRRDRPPDSASKSSRSWPLDAPTSPRHWRRSFPEASYLARGRHPASTSWCR